MSGTTVGRRDLLLASGAVLAGAGAAAQAEEKPRRLKFMVVGADPEYAEAFVLHPQSPDAPGLPQGPA